MHRNLRRPAAFRRAFVAATVVVVLAVLAACSPTASPPPASPGMPATPPPMEPTPVTGTGAVIGTPWGPVWDAVPAEFLLFAGAEPVEIDEPVSIALVHPSEAASPEDIAGAYVAELAIGGWRTVAGAPLEDGSLVVDAVRDGTACRAQVKATPLGGIVRITVLYGAECPKP